MAISYNPIEPHAPRQARPAALRVGKNVNMMVHGVGLGAGGEIYLTARPDPGLSLTQQGREIFAGIHNLLREKRAWICQERIFAPADAMQVLAKLRADTYGDLDDGVAPTWLVGGPENTIRGVQVYAIILPHRPRLLAVHGTPCGRLIHHQGCRWITASALPIHRSGSGETQTWAAFEEAEDLLKQAGADMTSIARTWCYLNDILGWYTSFNATRSRFFAERHLLNSAQTCRLPASTGIGVRPAGDARCLIDLFAVAGEAACRYAPQGCLCKHLAAGKQRSALEYGSSFARASTVCTPAGRTVFVSGTAAIDPTGATRCLGDASGQIRMTLECLRAVLGDLECPPQKVVQAVAYCKTAEVEECFRKLAPEPRWPWLVVRGDVCRDNLLFEAEVAGMIARN
ncbi:MAG: hypothetical protein ABSB74_14250 [Tepidisphaeraceae bacterium]